MTENLVRNKWDRNENAWDIDSQLQKILFPCTVAHKLWFLATSNMAAVYVHSIYTPMT